MCKYGFLGEIVSDNETQFSRTMVIEFCKDLGVQTKFVSVVHPQANGQAESVNNIILKGLTKNLDDAKGFWVEPLPKILWSYNTTQHSTTKETPFSTVYEADAMVLVEIKTSSWRRSKFGEEVNKIGLKYAVGLINEVREVDHVWEFGTKHLAARRYNFKVNLGERQKVDLILKKVVLPAQHGKM